jgi:predicted nucleic acid-binding Zn ribbon protein
VKRDSHPPSGEKEVHQLLLWYQTQSIPLKNMDTQIPLHIWWIRVVPARESRRVQWCIPIVKAIALQSHVDSDISIENMNKKKKRFITTRLIYWRLFALYRSIRNLSNHLKLQDDLQHPERG